MVEQGFSIQVFPSGNTDGAYTAMVDSQGWEGDRCIVSRNIIQTVIFRCPGAPQDGILYNWIDHMLAHVRQDLHIKLCGDHDPSIIMHDARPDRASGTPSQDM